MKKLLTVSLVAVMAVSAAHADIASTTYVDNAVQPVSTKVGSGDFAGTSLAGQASLTDAAKKLASDIASVAGGDIKLTESSAGTNVSIDTDGKINVATGTQTTLGVLKGGDGVTIGTGGEINVNSQVAGLDKAANATDGYYVSTVVQADGQVSEQKLAFSDSVTENDVNAPQGGAVKTYVDTQVGLKENADNKVNAITEGMDKKTKFPTVELMETQITQSNNNLSGLIGDQNALEAQTGETDVISAVMANDAAIETLNGGDDVAGSVANKVKALADGAVKDNADAIADMGAAKQDKSNVKYALGSGNGQWIDLMTTLPDTCKAANAVCTMVTKGGEMYWEVIAGGTDTEGKIDFTEPATQN